MLTLIHKKKEILNQNKDKGCLEFNIFGKLEKGHSSYTWLQHSVPGG